MTGQLGYVFKVCYPVVDVEDFATAHMLAIDAPEGERYCIVSEMWSMVKIGQMFATHFKSYGYPVGDKLFPYCMIKLLSFCNEESKELVRYWGKNYRVSNKKSIEKLGMKEYKKLDQIVKEMGYGMARLGIVPNYLEKNDNRV